MNRLSNGRSSSKTRLARVTEHSYEPEDEEIATLKVKFASLYEEDDATEEQEEDGEYGLKQKHRKIWRISSIKNGFNNHQQQQQQEKFVCNKCGKGFQSLKAKCGHMASHSEKAKVPSRNLFAKKKLARDDSQSDTESEAKPLTRRLRRTRYKKQNSVSVVGSKAKVDVYKNCSSEDSGVEQEQEEVAISLMMLSRDSANWGGLNSVDSSDNNSVVLEARSIGTKFDAQKDGLSTGHRADEASKIFSSEKVTAFGDSDLGFVRYNAKNNGMEVKARNFSKTKFEESRTEPHLRLKKLKRVMNAGLIRDGEGYNQTAKSYLDLYPKKSAHNEPYIAGYSSGNQNSNSEIHQRFEHKAHIHSQSYQAFNAIAEYNRSFTAASPYESGENSFDTDASLGMQKGKGILEHYVSNVCDEWKRSKHDYPVHSKVFSSSQALGGHRRVHLSEGSDEIKSDEVDVNFKQNWTQLHNFDLNHPAPLEDDEASEPMASCH